MKSRFTVTNAQRNIITAFLALVLVSFYAYCIITTLPWIDSPFAGFAVMKNNLVPVIGVPGWRGFEEGVRFGDIITAIDGEPVTSGDELNRMVALKKPGEPVTYTVNRRGEEERITVPVQVFTLRDYLIMFPLIMTVGAFFYIMGVVVFFLKPNIPESRAFLFNSVLVGFTLLSTPEYATNHTNYVAPITLCLIGPSFVLLGLYFPVALKWRKYIAAASLGTGFPLALAYLYSFIFLDVHAFTVVDTIMLVQISINNALGCFLVAGSFFRSKDQFTLQKAKIVVYGLSLTAFVCQFFVVGNIVLKIMVFFWALPISLAILPMTLGYAIVKHNLFDVDIFIRRTAGYVVLTVIVVALFFLLTGGLGMILNEILGRPSQLSAVLATLAMVAIARPMHNRIREQIDRRFYRERHEYSKTLQTSSRVLAKIIDKDRLLNELLDTIMDSIKIERGLLLLRDAQAGLFEVAVSRDYSEGFQQLAGFHEGGKTFHTYSPDHPLFRRLEMRGRALQLNDIDRPEVFGSDREPMMDALNALRIVLVIPILYDERLTGVLGLGPKRSGAWYSSEDVELLETLMNQAAISIENARSVEEMKKIVEIETSYRELKKIDEMKDNFLSMVSHDLRTPMTGIMAYASIMMENIDSIGKDEEVKYLDVIIQQGRRLTRLINDLLDIQRFEAGKITMEFEDIDLVKLVREVLALFEGAAREKSQKLELRSPPEEKIWINGSWDRLQQVMTNLLSNANKFTPEGGCVSVGMEILTRDGNRAVRVSVEDDGPGIPPEHRNRIFDKFQQVDKMVRGKAQGSGLGLSLVRWIIEGHDGRVGLESELEKGSVFYFILPMLERNE